MGTWYWIGVFAGIGVALGVLGAALVPRLLVAALGAAVVAAVAALAAGALAFVPIVGYLETVAVPALGLRLRSRTPERHAGLRTLARD